MKNWRCLSFSAGPFQRFHSLCRHSAKFVIGTDPTYAPFESKNAQGELVGFDIDLAKELCKRINTQCTFVENPLDALIPPKSQENRRDYVFAVDYRKAPAGNCLH
ncbi:transporter substrate-binding domain-containing protein [Klebsiella variicola subsp. variicola]|nr:transporter substrate-binding domain-containing protein [Klebsiella variicola subsp. variicola]